MIKVDEKDLQSVRDIRNNYQQVMLQLGQSELQINDLKSALDQVNQVKDNLLKRYEELKAAERTKMDELNKKYGAGNLNLESGIITPMPNQPQTPEVPKVEETPIPSPPVEEK